MDEKKFTYIVEAVYAKTDFDKEHGWSTFVNVHSVTFSGDNQEATKFDAQKEMDRIIRYGFSGKNGPVLRNQVLPSAIYNVALIDYNQYQALADDLAAKESSASVPADMPMTPEPAFVDSVVAS